MATKKKSAQSLHGKSKGDKYVTATVHDGVLRTNDIVAEQASANDVFVAAMPYNSIKTLEHGHDNAVAPPPGATVEPYSSSLIASIGPAMEKDPGILLTDSAYALEIAPSFIDAVAAHRLDSRNMHTNRCRSKLL